MVTLLMGGATFLIGCVPSYENWFHGSFSVNNIKNASGSRSRWRIPGAAYAEHHGQS
jgi:hypothetical protein